MQSYFSLSFYLNIIYYILCYKFCITEIIINIKNKNNKNPVKNITILNQTTGKMSHHEINYNLHI
jgi:hypothetical protein